MLRGDSLVVDLFPEGALVFGVRADRSLVHVQQRESALPESDGYRNGTDEGRRSPV